MSRGVSDKPLVNLVVAHGLEARPLIDALKLKVGAERPYKIYGNEAGLRLIICGNGQMAAANACAYLAGLQQSRPETGWLNIGICGHGEAELGRGLLINKITEARSGKRYYPTPLGGDFAGSALITVEEVECGYPEAVAYDMEGAGFWISASRHAGIDQLQCYKIVSDNPGHGVDKFHESQVQALLQARLPEIESLLAILAERSSARQALDYLPDAYYRLIEQVHFTVSQQRQLQEQFRLFKARGRSEELLAAIAGFQGAGADLLRQLQSRLHAEADNQSE